MNDWNPNQYLQFRTQRTQPSIDLVAKIDFAEPKTILDIGCGPGNSTQVLVHRWPKARIIGLDNSASMIAKAKTEYPAQEWILADAATYESDLKFDIVFSNATIHWIPNHPALISRIQGLLLDGGIVAVQLPLFWAMPLGQIIDQISRDSRWQSQTEQVSELFTIHDYSFYYDELSALFRKVDLWETTYMDILDSHQSIVEMIRSTGMKPYLERLGTDVARDEFEQEVLKEIMQVYPLQQNGKVILPFKRLFFIGAK